MRGIVRTEARHYRAPSNTPRTSSTALKSAKNGTRSVSSVSWGSLNHDETGTALFGWKMYDAGELSKMMVSVIGRPSCERSYRQRKMSTGARALVGFLTNLDIISSMVITAFSEKPVSNDLVDIQFI